MRLSLSLLGALFVLLALPAASWADPALNAAPSPLAFGGWDVDAGAKNEGVVITNVGDGLLDVTSASITGIDDVDFDVTVGACVGIGMVPQCTISVDFDPTTTGAKSATLQIVSNDPASPTSVPLTGTAYDIDLSAPSLAFGSRPVSAGATAVQTLTVTNDGGDPYSFSGVSLSGTDSAQFLLGNQTCSAGPVADSGGTCTVDVSFDPSSLGAKSATLELASTGNATIAVPLTGTGTGPALTRGPSGTIAFGNQPVTGGATAGQTVTITNSGTANLTISGIALTGAGAAQFDSVPSGACTAPIAPTAQCTVSVTYDPLVTGSHTADLSITSDAAGSPHLVPLTGTGTAPAVSAAPTAVSFGNQAVSAGASAAQTVTVTNTGDAPLLISGITVTGADAAQFNSTPTGCAGAIAPAGTCTVDLTYDPSAVGAHSATLSIADDALGSPHTVALTGTGTSAPAAVGLSQSTLDFGSQDVAAGATAAQTITVTNTGGQPLSLATIAGSGAIVHFSFGVGTCSGSIAPAQTCQLTASFDPTSVGAHSATYTIAHDGSNSPVTVTVTGTGTETGVTPPPTQCSYKVAPGCASHDLIIGTPGKDTLFGGGGNDVMQGKADDDTLSGGDGNDTILGGPGNDTLDGGDGNDVFKGDVDTEIITGGAGNDTMTFGVAKKLTVDAGPGNDKFVSRGVRPTVLAVKLGLGADSATVGRMTGLVQAGAGNDKLVGAGAGVRLAGNEGDDTITVANVLHISDAGLSGGAGKDAIVVGVKTRRKGAKVAKPKPSVVDCGDGSDTATFYIDGLFVRKSSIVATPVDEPADLGITVKNCEDVRIL